MYLIGKVYVQILISGDLCISDALDRETKLQYELNVSAIDGGHSPNRAFQIVTINVVDVNDNLPVFSQQLYRYEIPENQVTGSTISPVPANQESVDDASDDGILVTDADVGSNAEIRYEIQQEGSLFRC